jgi:hypothetical protein
MEREEAAIFLKHISTLRLVLMWTEEVVVCRAIVPTVLAKISLIKFPVTHYL